MVREPARATLRKLLTLNSPTIRIRSPRNNVCDICAIYYTGLRGGFGHIRKYMATAECWHMKHTFDAVNAAASTSITVHVPRGNDLFKSYKPVLTELYKRMDGVQQFQIFAMDISKPGTVTCKKGHVSVAVIKDLRRKIDGISTAKEKVVQIMVDHVEILPPPPPNTEKKSQLYHSISPYVPEEFQNDSLYAKPTEQEGESVKATKQARLAHRAAMATAAKKNQEQRGIVQADPEAKPTAKAKKKPTPKNRGATNKKAPAKSKKHKTPTAENEQP
ncbi:hypothetical protein PI125_g9266 [Phytophthora idaei]|nr:hypothetical protein PI125_g9266 [Phytophthora idaei]KAG3157664.1 hypothetical protein PI126_g8209 [Phytophthora idaei]